MAPSRRHVSLAKSPPRVEQDYMYAGGSLPVAVCGHQVAVSAEVLQRHELPSRACQSSSIVAAQGLLVNQWPAWALLGVPV